MGANAAFDPQNDPASDPPNESAGELYAAVASMRAHAVRMRAISANQNAEPPPPMAQNRGEVTRMHSALHAEFEGAQAANTAEPRADNEDATAFHAERGQLDAAAEHLERGRLPDLNALAHLMMEMKGAQRAYELNLQMIDATHAMMARTVDLLRR